jgi:hypothetical protein
LIEEKRSAAREADRSSARIAGPYLPTCMISPVRTLSRLPAFSLAAIAGAVLAAISPAAMDLPDLRERGRQPDGATWGKRGVGHELRF